MGVYFHDLNSIRTKVIKENFLMLKWPKKNSEHLKISFSETVKLRQNMYFFYPETVYRIYGPNIRYLGHKGDKYGWTDMD